MRRRIPHLLTLALLALAPAAPSGALEPSVPAQGAVETVPAPRPRQVSVERISATAYRVGEIIIDAKERSISLPTQVNMQQGLLEYLLVRGTGKTHESLLRTTVLATDLQVALLLVGLKGTEQPLTQQGDPRAPGGDPVEITLSCTDAAGNTTSVGPEAWIARKVGEKLQGADKFSWVFTGSMIRGQAFLAQLEGSIIAIYHDPAALMDNGSTGGESDRIWFVSETGVPPVGTPVQMTIRPARSGRSGL